MKYLNEFESMLKHSNYIVLGTAQREERSASANITNGTELRLDLRTAVGHRNVLDVVGVYAGSIEPSNAIACDCYYEVNKVVQLVMQDKYSQECVLVYDRRAQIVGLVYPDGHQSIIGKCIRAIGKEDIGEITDYTAFGGNMYIVPVNSTMQD